MRIFRTGLGAVTSRALIPSLIVMSALDVTAAGPQGTIQVVTEPAGAEVFVDGQRKGVTPVVIDGLPSGEHRVRIVKDGFVENSQVVSVAPGVGGAVNVKMSRTAAASAPAAPTQATPTPAAEAPSEGWSTRKKALVGGGAAALIAGGIALLGGGDDSSTDGPNAAPVVGSIGVTPAGGQTLAGVTNFSFTAEGASDPDSQPLTYSWNFGDGANGTGQTAAHVYSTGGIFTVSLTVSDGSQSATTTRTVQVGDVNATWLNRYTEQGFPEGLSRRVRFIQSGVQLTGTYRTNIVPGRTGTVSGRLSPPRNITFEAHLRDAKGQDVGFSFNGTLNDDLTAFIGVGNGYLLRNRRMGFGRTDEE